MMTAIHVRMRCAGNDRELRPKLLQQLQILRRFVVAAGGRRHEIESEKTEAEIDCNEAAFHHELFAATGPRQPRQKRQSYTNARCTQKVTSIYNSSCVPHYFFPAKNAQMP